MICSERKLKPSMMVDAMQRKESVQDFSDKMYAFFFPPVLNFTFMNWLAEALKKQCVDTIFMWIQCDQEAIFVDLEYGLF